MRATGFDPVAAEGGSASVEKIEASEDTGISQFVSRGLTKLDRPGLTSARRIVLDDEQRQRPVRTAPLLASADFAPPLWAADKKKAYIGSVDDPRWLRLPYWRSGKLSPPDNVFKLPVALIGGGPTAPNSESTSKRKSH